MERPPKLGPLAAEEYGRGKPSNIAYSNEVLDEKKGELDPLRDPEKKDSRLVSPTSPHRKAMQDPSNSDLNSPHKIEQLGLRTKSQVEKLASFWVTSIEELMALARTPEGCEGL
jgi:hypothetical protein